MKKLKCWIEAMRLRTLPVSSAGVVMAAGLCISHGSYQILPLIYCLIFAVLAQIASNFANEYYDFRDGLDKPGREGPRRGVTEGDITPGAMKTAVYATLALAAVFGLMLIPYGGWWLIIAGIAIFLGALAYSTGPYPLSRHCMGEVAVIIFFGIVPVNLTCYVSAGIFSTDILLASLAIGFMGANVLIVNNYRDANADRAAGKHTLAQKLGKRGTILIYFQNGVVATALLVPLTAQTPAMMTILMAYLVLHILLTFRLSRLSGRALNPLLGQTAIAMFLLSIAYLLVV